MLELDVLPGLEQFAQREVEKTFAAPIHAGEGRLILNPPHLSLPEVNALRTVTAAYCALGFDIPRPKALLGDQHLRRLTHVCEGILAGWPPGTFRTLGLSAAGADSAVLVRLKRELAAGLGVEPSDSGGDLVLRIRRADAPSGWTVLIRTSPRPLSTRAWRVCNFPGALNATVAYAMATLAQPSAGDVFVNIGCGSGTLLIERLEHGPAQRALGFDVDESALACARANAEAGGHASALTLSCCDARALPLETGSVDAVVADLPYAMLLGNPSVNSTLYPELLSEAARVLVGGGSGVFITTQNRLMRGVLGRQSALWKLDSTVRVRVPHTGGYISPTIYSLVRRDLV